MARITYVVEVDSAAWSSASEVERLDWEDEGTRALSAIGNVIEVTHSN